uniref:Putative secreted protein n=1 Tax=Anopheles darlingi TaxID=43151 RepID=A0A2M4D5K9_ANODA
MRVACAGNIVVFFFSALANSSRLSASVKPFGSSTRNRSDSAIACTTSMLLVITTVLHLKSKCRSSCGSRTCASTSKLSTNSLSNLRTKIRFQYSIQFEG